MKFFLLQNRLLRQFLSTIHIPPQFSLYGIIIIYKLQIMGKLKGKQIKDYLFGDSLLEFEGGSELASAVKGGKINLTVYGIPFTLIDENTFPLYNNEIAQNKYKIYPVYLQAVRSQHFLYMILEQLKKPNISYNNLEQVRKFLNGLQMILNSVCQKISPQQIFMKTDGTNELCVILDHTKFAQKSTNLYTRFHNKSTLGQLFCHTIPTRDKNKTLQIFIQNIEKYEIFDKIKPCLIQISKPNEIKSYEVNHRSNNIKIGGKSSIKSLIEQSYAQYPQIDDKQFQQLITYCKVNPNLKKQAGNAYMRQSAQERKSEAEKEIADIVDDVNKSIFKQYKNSKKSTVQIKLNRKKQQDTQFQVHFEAHYQIFKLLKDIIRAYLQKYKNGFTGIIAAYLLTLIGILRRLKLYTDLDAGFDIYQIGVQNKNFSKYTNKIKKQLSKEARGLVNLKNIIQNANMPIKTYEALIPFLSQDLESIDLQQVQKFCFFYMTVLMKKNQNKSRYEILFMQIMYVFISPFYSIVYSEQDVPKAWDQKYFELKKILISTLMPQWQI